MEIKKGPLSDPDSFFAALAPKDTAKVISILRENNVTFDVSIDPNWTESEPSDVFWFNRSDDMSKIQALIYSVTKGQEKP